MFQYEILTARNAGYISSEAQLRIQKTRVLIAGCGIGSQLAECLVRMGFQNFILVDADQIEQHNLNRQFFFFDQIGKNKAAALRDNLSRINPSAQVQVFEKLVTPQNAKELVELSDVIFDTIDFLDLEAIVSLHDEAHAQGKLVLSSFGAGFGGALLAIPPNSRSHSWIRDIFSLPSQGPVGGASYVDHFIKLFSQLATFLDPLVTENMFRVFKSMKDGVPCPAPQVAPGAHSVALLCGAAISLYFEGKKVTEAPHLILTNPIQTLSGPGIELTNAP